MLIDIEDSDGGPLPARLCLWSGPSGPWHCQLQDRHAGPHVCTTHVSGTKQVLAIERNGQWVGAC